MGLGKLGLPLAVVLASKGYAVTGVDLNAQVVEKVNRGIAPMEETGLQTLMTASVSRLTATCVCEEAVLHSEATFIVVPTPSGPDHLFSNDYVHSALEEVGRALAKKKTYHLVVVTSTVTPGSMEGELQRTLELYAQRRVGDHLGWCYNPEFIALGSVIKDTLCPDLVLIGESDRFAGDRLEAIYQTLCENAPPVRRMSLINAELTKIGLNTFLTAKISYANMLSDLCDRLHGADVDVVTEAVGLDTRIGSKYLRAGAAFGGPCFPRDNLALTALAKREGARADLSVATDAINNYQFERVQKMVERYALSKRVGILGLSYKVGTNVVEASQGIRLAKHLAEHHYHIVGYDPLVKQKDSEALFTLASSIEACFEAVDTVVIMTPWPLFAQTITEHFLQKMGRKVIIDCWRLLRKENLGEGSDLIYLGMGR